MSQEQILELENEADQLRNDGKYAEAIEKTLAILELDASFARAHLTLSVLYNKTEDYEKSCHHAEKACELEPNEPFNVTALSVTYQRAFEGTRDETYIQKAEEALARAHARQAGG